MQFVRMKARRVNCIRVAFGAGFCFGKKKISRYKFNVNLIEYHILS